MKLKEKAEIWKSTLCNYKGAEDSSLINTKFHPFKDSHLFLLPEERQEWLEQFCWGLMR